MFIFGHLGIGSKIVRPLGRALPQRWLLLGTVLPDLVDKPIYYGLSWTTHLHGAELGLISGTRTFGHTALFTLAIALAAYFRSSRVWAALALGAASHLLLDGVTDQFSPSLRDIAGPASALLWPFTHQDFPIIPHPSLGHHLSVVSRPFILWAELGGALLLAWDLWRKKVSVKPLRRQR
jgi:hypothetical protein